MVTRSALQHAASIAKNILMTEAIVAEAPEKQTAGAAMGGMGGMGGMGDMMCASLDWDCLRPAFHLRARLSLRDRAASARSSS